MRTIAIGVLSAFVTSLAGIGCVELGLSFGIHSWWITLVSPVALIALMALLGEWYR